MRGDLSRKYRKVQLKIPVTNAPQKLGTIDPMTGIAPMPLELTASATKVPVITLAPVASIFATALILSPGR